MFLVGGGVIPLAWVRVCGAGFLVDWDLLLCLTVVVVFCRRFVWTAFLGRCFVFLVTLLYFTLSCVVSITPLLPPLLGIGDST